LYEQKNLIFIYYRGKTAAAIRNGGQTFSFSRLLLISSAKPVAKIPVGEVKIPIFKNAMNSPSAFPSK